MEGLEDVMIDCARGFGVRARGRVPGMTGVWAGDKKLGAVGVQISQGIASHGLAMNHSLSLDWFDRIVPCGLEGRAVTTLERECGTRLEHEAVQASLVECFARRFGYDDVHARALDADGWREASIFRTFFSFVCEFSWSERMHLALPAVAGSPWSQLEAARPHVENLSSENR